MDLTERTGNLGWVVAGATVAWVAVLLGAPYLSQASGGAVGLVYVVGGLICHQAPDRSFHVAGAQLPVCARCLGLYLGGAAGAVLWMVGPWRRWRPLRREVAVMLLATAAVPTAVTVAGALAGLGDPSNAWRAVLALPLGLAGGGIVAAAATSHLK